MVGIVHDGDAKLGGEGAHEHGCQQVEPQGGAAKEGGIEGRRKASQQEERLQDHARVVARVDLQRRKNVRGSY